MWGPGGGAGERRGEIFIMFITLYTVHVGLKYPIY